MYHNDGARLGQSTAPNDQRHDHSAKVSGLAGGSIARDRGALEVALDQNGSALDELQSAVSRLDDRLQQVLLPSAPPPAPGTAAGGHAPMRSPAVGYLEMQTERMQSLRRRIHDIADRLEV